MNNMSIGKLLHGIDNKIWTDCRVTRELLKMAHNVFGENSDFVQGKKTNQKVAAHVETTKPTNVHVKLLKRFSKGVIICIDYKHSTYIDAIQM